MSMLKDVITKTGKHACMCAFRFIVVHHHWHMFVGTILNMYEHGWMLDLLVQAHRCIDLSASPFNDDLVVHTPSRLTHLHLPIY